MPIPKPSHSRAISLRFEKIAAIKKVTKGVVVVTNTPPAPASPFLSPVKKSKLYAAINIDAIKSGRYPCLFILTEICENFKMANTPKKVKMNRKKAISTGVPYRLSILALGHEIPQVNILKMIPMSRKFLFWVIRSLKVSLGFGFYQPHPTRYFLQVVFKKTKLPERNAHQYHHQGPQERK